MQILILAVLVVGLQSAVYHLTKQVSVGLSVDPSLTICQTFVRYQTIYGLAVNTTHFMAYKYHFPDNFMLQDQSTALPATYDGNASSPYNPTMVKTNTAGVIVKHQNTSGAYITIINNNNFSSFRQQLLSDNFQWLHLSIIDAIFFRKANGAAGVLSRYTVQFSENQTYSTSTAAVSLEDMILLESSQEEHVASIDKGTGEVTITKFSYNQEDKTVTDAVVTVLQMNTTVVGGCFDRENFLFIMTSINKVYRISLAIMGIIPFSKTYTATEHCYYDWSITSLMTMQQTDAATVTINQLSLHDSDTISYQLAASHIAFLNNYVFHLINANTFTTFEVESCAEPYSVDELKCSNCREGCDICNGSRFCRQCSSGWYKDRFSNFHSLLLQFCQPCADNCSVCTSEAPEDCTECLSGSQFDNNSLCIPVVTPIHNEINSSNSTLDPASASLVLDMVSTFTNLVSQCTNSVPSARAIFKPLLYAMVSFDDLFPYMFHERDYGDTIEELFDTIHAFEIEKWTYYDQYVVNPFLQLIWLNHDKLEASLDRYKEYSSPTFLRRESVGESVLIAAFSFLTTNFLLSVALFLLCRGLFRLLFRYRLSRIFRPESFWTFLPFFVMEGNLQIVTFYACSVLRLNFFRNRAQKLQVAAIYLGLYLLFFFGVAGYLLVFQKLRRLSKYFSDNLTPSFPATVFLTIEFGLKNLLLALIHSLFRSQSLFRVQLSSLAAVELLCLGNCLLFLRRKGCFELRIKAWASVVIGSLRFLLILSLWLQQESLRDALLLEVIESAIKTVLTLYFGLTFLMLGASLLHCLVATVRFIRPMIFAPRPKEKQKNPTPILQNIKQKSSEKSQKKNDRILDNNPRSVSKGKSKSKPKKSNPKAKAELKAPKDDSKGEAEPKLDRRAKAIQRVSYQKDAAQVVGQALRTSLTNGKKSRFNTNVDKIARYADSTKPAPKTQLPTIKE